MKMCKKFEFPATKNWDKYSHLLEKKISWFSLIKTYFWAVLTQKRNCSCRLHKTGEVRKDETGLNWNKTGF